MDWDSKFFGFPVARIQQPNFLGKQLSEELAELKRNGIRLAYWVVNELGPADVSAVQRLGGFECPLRFTYETAVLQSADDPTIPVFPYTDRQVSAELRALALESGVYSRFRLDPHFPTGKYEELYSLWIENSVSHLICDEVLVYRTSKGIAGMITVGQESGNGKIGLVAVDANHRGQGIGTALMNAAAAWFGSQKLAKAVVVTQGKNLGATRLYEKSGYRLTRKQSTFHFWLE